MSDEEQQVPPQTQDEVKTEGNLETINIKVVSSTGEEVFFKIKRNTKLSKLRGAYANKVGKDINSIRFLYEGNRINDEDTPGLLEMEENDTIDVMVEQVGGSTVVPWSPTMRSIFRSYSFRALFNVKPKFRILPNHSNAQEMPWITLKIEWELWWQMKPVESGQVLVVTR